jgi:hypothetical protein
MCTPLCVGILFVLFLTLYYYTLPHGIHSNATTFLVTFRYLRSNFTGQSYLFLAQLI